MKNQLVAASFEPCHEEPANVAASFEPCHEEPACSCII